MTTIFFRTIKDRWRMAVALVAIGVLTQLMYISLFPTYSKSFAESDQLFSQMPEALKKAFNIDQFSFDTLDKFLTIEMYSFFWIILAILLLLSLAGTGFSGEVERETVTLTAAQPVSRSHVFVSRVLAGLALFTAFNLLVNGVVVPFAAAFNLAIDASHLLAVTVVCQLFGMAIGGIAVALSSFLSEKSKVYMILGGALLVTYVFNILSGISDQLDFLKYLSPFYYFNPNTFFVKGEYDALSLAVFGVLTIVSFAIGWWQWNRRDVL